MCVEERSDLGAPSASPSVAVILCAWLTDENCAALGWKGVVENVENVVLNDGSDVVAEPVCVGALDITLDETKPEPVVHVRGLVGARCALTWWSVEEEEASGLGPSSLSPVPTSLSSVFPILDSVSSSPCLPVFPSIPGPPSARARGCSDLVFDLVCLLTVSSPVSGPR